MSTNRRIHLPLLAVAAIVAGGVLAGPASANAAPTTAAFSTAGSPSTVMLNPQPLPPRWVNPVVRVGLNPQPLPPRVLGF